MIRIESKDVACVNDAYVNVMDISLTGVKQLIFRYCSEIVPIDPIRSSWHMMEVLFKSGDDTSNNGFVAQYQLVDFAQDVITDTSDGMLICKLGKQFYTYFTYTSYCNRSICQYNIGLYYYHII